PAVLEVQEAVFQRPDPKCTVAVAQHPLGNDGKPEAGNDILFPAIARDLPQDVVLTGDGDQSVTPLSGSEALLYRYRLRRKVLRGTRLPSPQSGLGADPQASVAVLVERDD